MSSNGDRGRDGDWSGQGSAGQQRSPKQIAASLNRKGEQILAAVDACDRDHVPTSFITDWSGYSGDETRYLRQKFVREELLSAVDTDPEDTRGTSSTVYRLEPRGEAVRKYLADGDSGEDGSGARLGEVAETASDAHEIATTQKMALQQYRERVAGLEDEVEELRGEVADLRVVLDEQAEYIEMLRETGVEKTPRRVEILRRAFEDEFEVDLREYAET